MDFKEMNEVEITSYIERNNLKATKTNSGLYYVIEEEGTGAQPNASSYVTVAYKGYFTNGKVFDQSDAKGIGFPLSGVISGWTEGITYFTEGGKGTLLIPSHLGYGETGAAGVIPGGSVLLFDIHLITVK